ncbi:hypothetical protein CDL15_Pgr013255 [Punica granatum]|uniref:Embryogenesis-associated protein EMB8 n=1 Tax=Punica granatum TaxID=22663 RepID=A0A218WQ53_PUNGR|nr:hypothetical protein CDL15_Pgr013255 [Punica granatum]
MNHHYHLQSPSKSRPSLLFPREPQFRVYKRRRLKPIPVRPLRCLHLTFQSQFENLLHSLASQFPPNDLLPSALAFASGAALSISQGFAGRGSLGSHRRDIGEWILFSSPTPFNRFVLLRCPSISFVGSELLEDVNERLVKEDRHFVKLSSGRMQVRIPEVDHRRKDSEPKLEYQRLCIGAEDGGVISLDWPANLDLKEERGLDSTLLLVPGTAEGSMHEDVRAFVLEALQRGFFPVVMNPRGCAGSPLTTARLFTAADSDDISTAIHFISKARPWTTLMGVGWGFGANMLTKYLAEVGEKTPLTAATCINNPFDLEEATRSFPYHVAIDEKLAGGLKDILRANKELFQGKAKGFDVEKALSTNSVRDFERAISMVPYEFEAVEDFYSRSSTRDLVGNVKVPVLFIQWLAAVELGLLKGRHPLLKNIDISINPSKGLSLVEGNISNQSTKINKFLELDEVDEYSIGKMSGMLEDGDITATPIFGSMKDQQRELGKVNDVAKVVKDGGLQQSSSVDAELVKGEGESSMDTERGQVLRSAEVVLNMLDVTMPGVLTEDKKMKVLTAMSQGETLMKALHDAVPEDVRGKITHAVSGVLQAQGANLKLNKLDTGHIPNFSPMSKAKKEESVHDISSQIASSKDNQSSDQMAKAEDSGSENGSFNGDQLRHSSGLESELQSSGKSASSFEDETKSTGESENSFDSEELSREKASDSSIPSRAETASGSEDMTADALADSAAKELVDRQKSEERSPDSLSEEKNMTSPKVAEDVQSSSEFSSEVPNAEKDKNDDQKKENKSMQSPSNSTPSFSVTEALDALTGMDDSTQVAVNSVFGVLEEMISQLEEGSDNEDGDGKVVKDKEVGASSQNQERTHGVSIEEKEVSNKESGSDSHPNGFHEEELAQYSGRQDTVNGIGKGENIESNQLVNSRFSDTNNVDKLRLLNGLPLYATTKPYGGLLRDEYIRRYLFSKLPTKPLDMDTTAALLLDYIPEEGQWKLLEPPGSNGDSTGSVASTTGMGVNRTIKDESSANVDIADEIIETTYVVMDSEEVQPPVKEYAIKDRIKKHAHTNDMGSFQLMHFIKKIILDCLKVEVDRRMNVEDKKEMEPSLAVDCELVANAVCSAVSCDEDLALDLKARTYSIDHSYEKIGTLHGELIVEALSSAVQETNYLKRVLPVGVVVGSCLAALREFFNVVSAHDNATIERDTTDGTRDRANIFSESLMKETALVEMSRNKSDTELNNREIDSPPDKKSDKDNSDDWLRIGDKNDKSKETRNRQVMVGVVTAALGTSALLVKQQEMGKGNENVGISSESFKEEGTHKKELGEVSSEKDHTNLVTSLAEKAMSVAAPVVPTKDGEVDQERLVAILAEWGQRGGLLRLVGKVALLWGGLRGAMGFTNKLISFLHIAERPLIQRIVAFVCLVLVLWSPVLVPLLPILVQSWMSRSPSKIAEVACIVGLYAAVIILVMLWGRRIRGYEKPFRQYGLDLTSSQKVHDLLKGLVGGVMLILAIQILNSSIGCTNFCWPPGLRSPSLDPIAKLKAYTKVLSLAGQGFVAAIAIAVVEELLFRSWLPEEISADLGYHWGIILSGLAFSLLQRPFWALPGLWLLSVSLFGIRHRNEGNLSIPIGLRAGIIASNYILQRGGFLTFAPNAPFWIVGTHPFQPFSGVVGLWFALVMAIIFYPRECSMKQQQLTRTVRE